MAAQTSRSANTSMWFVEGPDDMTPCPVVDDCAAEDGENKMWLVAPA
eukprot:CAMPEP_0182579968 /NCGR_PEP_ID=MMETSP1324-20130603/45634_1 /TAXON_ID=236786 /ORGANISM="Florenciella sp., Strain RCC1587" /LENGTH=46 /DNA_ID= /DNA_START= /DNA_END= /DNA_ORIENTATION=